jgi:hypothetical protein
MSLSRLTDIDITDLVQLLSQDDKTLVVKCKYETGTVLDIKRVG